MKVLIWEVAGSGVHFKKTLAIVHRMVWGDAGRTGAGSRLLQWTRWKMGMGWTRVWALGMESSRLI